jgi:hypothetical protein
MVMFNCICILKTSDNTGSSGKVGIYYCMSILLLDMFT